MVQRWHIIEGEAGCRFAVENQCAAIIVDALRASATAAMLLHHGAGELLVTGTVEAAFAAKAEWPDALIFGERGGLPPEGFDYGNSPLETTAAAGRRVIFTTTTGAQRLLSAHAAPLACMGTTVNAKAVCRLMQASDLDVVVIPAGLYGDDAFDAQEDRAAAVYLAMTAEADIGEGRALFDTWREPILHEGMEKIFAAAPHAEKLRAVDKAEDIAYCARADITEAVPVAAEKTGSGIVVRRV